MSRLKILVKTHPFTCASYNPFESLHIDHIGPLPPDDKVYTHILVMIDAFSHWAELFWTPDIIHTDQGPAFRNELFAELTHLSKVKLTRKKETVSRSHAPPSCHTFYARVHDKWSYEQLPMVQRIMNTVEETSTGVTPSELILNNSIRISARILAMVLMYQVL